jgi:hypothetical protein
MNGQAARWGPLGVGGILLGTGLWLLLLAGGLVLPWISAAPAPGDELTRNPVRLALLYYAAAASLMICLRPGEVPAVSVRAGLARWFWTLAWAAYLVHVGMAFHHYHHWSHAEAMAHTRRASGVGEGIYLSYLFTLLWGADVVSWWLRPVGRAARPRWISGALHGFMAFMIFNATVVFGTGWIRAAGAILLGELAGLWLLRWWKSTAPPTR